MSITLPKTKNSEILKDKETPLDRTLRMKKKEFEQKRKENKYNSQVTPGKWETKSEC